LKKLIFILLSLAIISSCREDFISPLTDTREEINFVSELNPDAPVEANIFKSINLGGGSNGVDPHDAIVLFSGTDLPSKQTAMIYYPDDDVFRIRNGFAPSPGNTYEIVAYLPDSDIDTIRARTYMPKPVSLENLKIIEVYKTDVTDNKAQYHIRASVTLSTPVRRPAYFQIIPYRKVSTYRVSNTGEIMITNTNDVVSLNVDQIITSQNGVVELIHKEGVFVDYSRVGGNEIIIDLSTKDPLNLESEIFKILDFQLNTMSEELYLYHVNLSKQLINSRSDFSSPIISYSNITNGYGVLGAYSTTITSIEL
jgi:hypothetical protein